MRRFPNDDADGSAPTRPDEGDETPSDDSTPTGLHDTDEAIRARSDDSDTSGAAGAAVSDGGPRPTDANTLSADDSTTSDASAASSGGETRDVIVSATGLCKEYGGTTAVDDIDLAVEAGTVYGFLGPNGAGKTTTMRILTGLVEPTAGEASVAGVAVDDRRALVERIGLLPEEPPLYEELTGREQLRFAADLRGAGSVVTDRAAELAERLDLAADLDERIEGYSKGMRQKTAFVQAAAHDPDAVFLDEPTSGLDPRAARTLRETITELAAGGTAVFLSTHILPVVEEIADRVGVLFDGRIVADGTPEAVTQRVGDGTLEDAFLDLTREDAW